MKFFNNKIFVFFSLGLNVGFLVFLAFHLVTLPDTRRDKALKISLTALSQADVSDEQEQKIIQEVTLFHNSLQTIHKDLHETRMTLLYLYSQQPRDRVKIEETEKALKTGSAQKNTLISEHIKTLDRILGDASQDYFTSVHKLVKAHFQGKR